jgi:hypothetical protein
MRMIAPTVAAQRGDKEQVGDDRRADNARGYLEAGDNSADRDAQGIDVECYQNLSERYDEHRRPGCLPPMFGGATWAGRCRHLLWAFADARLALTRLV